MIKHITEVAIGLTIGAVIGIAHYQSTTDRIPWYLENRPEMEICEVTLPEPETEEIHYLHEDDVIDDEIPDEVVRAAEYWGFEYDICPELLESMAYQESRFRASIKSANGSCIGLMQVNPKWHKDRMKKLGVTTEDLLTVNGSMAVAADYLSVLFEKYEDPVTVLMLYNGDERAFTGKTSAYAREILKRSEEYEIRHHKK